MDCLLPTQAEKLKEAFESGKITDARLFDMTPEKRVEFFREYVGDKNAKEITAKFEKGYMAPKQKQAFTKLAFEMMGHKPLYKGVSIEDANKLAEVIDPRELRKMTAEQVAKKLSPVLGEKKAQKLADRFAHLKKTNNLKLWEKKVIGTEKLRSDQQLLKGLNKINALDSLGVLTPTQIEKFMPSLIENKLGVDLNMEESKKLSKLNRRVMDSFDEVMKTDNWTWENGDNVEKYFNNLKELKDFAQILGEDKKLISVDNANKIISYGRNSLLATPKSFVNSGIYQIPPSLERALVKRIVSGQMTGNKDWAVKQLKMAIRIYNKTGYDISRMESLGTGDVIFGGEKFKSLPKKKGLLNKYARAVELGPKYGAGGTDMIIANLGRAETAWMQAKTIVRKEVRQGKTTKAEAKKRVHDLVVESHSFNPQSEEAQIVRTNSMLDAHMSNNTQASDIVDRLLGVRKLMKIKGINFGNAVIPFARIALTNTLRSMKIASGAEVAENIMLLKKSFKIEDRVQRETTRYKAITTLVGYLGIMGLVTLLSAGLKTDDYIGSWDTISFKKYSLAKSRNAGAGYVKLFGHWLPIKYLPLINVPLSALMMARQAKEKGLSYMSGYALGIVGGALEAPIISQVNKFLKGTAKNIDSLAKNGKLSTTQKDVINWLIPRAIPTVLSRPLLNHFKAQRYDFLGRPTLGGFIINKDTTNQTILEFNRLDKTGNMPIISDPSGDYTVERLNELKQNYAKKVNELINSEKYQSKTDKEKKNAINAIRTKEILNKLK